MSNYPPPPPPSGQQFQQRPPFPPPPGVSPMDRGQSPRPLPPTATNIRPGAPPPPNFAPGQQPPYGYPRPVNTAPSFSPQSQPISQQMPPQGYPPQAPQAPYGRPSPTPPPGFRPVQPPGSVATPPINLQKGMPLLPGQSPQLSAVQPPPMRPGFPPRPPVGSTPTMANQQLPTQARPVIGQSAARSPSPQVHPGFPAQGVRPPQSQLPQLLASQPPQLGQNNPSQPINPAASPPPLEEGISPSQFAADQKSQLATQRRRHYPDQITNAYSDTTPHSYNAPQFTTPGVVPAVQASHEPQYFVPGSATGAPAYGNQAIMQPQSQTAAGYQQPVGAPGYGAQEGINSMASQFSQMGFSGQPGFPSQPGQGIMQRSLHNVSLIGLAPNILDLDAPPPPILLPQNASVTDSPHVNAPTSYQRCTINAIPTTQPILNKSRLPFGLVIAPYRRPGASDDPNDLPVPVVTDTVIARCRRCRTYINPFITFVEGGQRWKCNMCYLLNDVPSSFDYDVQTQKPVDRYSRAELNHGVVEFVAPTEYMFRPPQPPQYVFLIDVSYAAIQNGMLATAARTILESLDRLPNADDRTKVAFITVDSSLHFYNLNPSLTEPQMLVVADLEDAALPLPQDLLCNLTESRAIIETLLGKLAEMFKDNASVGFALGPGLQAAYKLVSVVGGKIIVLTSTLPNIGTGALKPREDVKLLGTPKETTLLQAASPFYKSFAIECSRYLVGVDMFLFGSHYSDVATLSNIPRYTSGQTYFYPAFNAARTEDAIKFAHEFSEFLSEEIALEAVIRVRTSKGLRCSTYYGNFFVRSTDLLGFPNVPRDQGYCLEVTIEEQITAPFVCLQTALLHTTCFGERRIRVVTTCLPTTTVVGEIFASADQIAIATLLINKAIERALNSKLEDARDALTNKVVDILGVYKSQMTSSSGASPQLQICDNLKLLPLLVLGMLKHVGLRQSSQIPTDLRANAMNLLTTMPAQLLVPYLHPRFYSLHNMPPEIGIMGENGVNMPTPLNLSSEKLERHGCYMLEDGQNIFIWIGREVVAQLCVDLLGLSSYESVRGGKITLPTLDTPLNQRVNLIIAKTREMRRGNYYPQLYLVKEDGEPALRLWFLSHLIEDRSDTLVSYYQWLGTIKDKVNSGSF